MRVWNGISVNSLTKKINEEKKHRHGKEGLENSRIANSQGLDHKSFDITQQKGFDLEM